MSDLPTCDCYETYPGPGTHRGGCLVRQEIERLTAQVESLQNKWANRELSQQDSDALMAENEHLTAERDASRRCHKEAEAAITRLGERIANLEALLKVAKCPDDGCEMKDKRIDWTVADNVKKAMRIEQLEGAIGDVYQCWLRDGNSATWGGVLPRLFEALASEADND